MNCYQSLTFEQFRKGYRNSHLRIPLWRSLLGRLPGRRDFDKGYGRRWDVAWFGLAFDLHCRVPDIRGFYGADAEEARWCWPWQFYRLYWEARIAPRIERSA